MQSFAAAGLEARPGVTRDQEALANPTFCRASGQCERRLVRFLDGCLQTAESN